MTEPTTAAAGGIAGYKLALFSLPVIASLLAFWLGLRFVPLRSEDPRGDMLNRVLACLVSGFAIGVPLLVMLMQHMPGFFAAGVQLALMAELPAVAGFFVITGCVLVVSSMPGPWIVAAVFIWLERRKGKDIAEMAQEVREDVANIVGGKSASAGGTP